MSDSLTKTLVIANVLVYVILGLVYGGVIGLIITPKTVLYMLGFYNKRVLMGEYWRFITSLFIHAGFWHIFLNMLWFYIFGVKFEEKFGSLSLFIVYFASGIIGNVFTLIFYGPETNSVGASGCIFGVLGAYVVASKMSAGEKVGGAIANILVYCILISLAPGINLAAHLGGLVTGIVLGFIVALVKRRGRRYPYEYYGYYYCYPSRMLSLGCNI